MSSIAEFQRLKELEKAVADMLLVVRALSKRVSELEENRTSTLTLHRKSQNPRTI